MYVFFPVTSVFLEVCAYLRDLISEVIDSVINVVYFPILFAAFLMILENPNSTQQWLNDPDTGPMLIQISKIYHTERPNAS